MRKNIAKILMILSIITVALFGVSLYYDIQNSNMLWVSIDLLLIGISMINTRFMWSETNA